MMGRKVMCGASGAGGDPILSPSHPNLVAMYTMDSISGATLVDESANANDGTIVGATAVAGLIGNALDFDGLNDRVDVPFAVQGSGDFTISLHINPDAVSGDYRFIGIGQLFGEPGVHVKLLVRILSGVISVNIANSLTTSQIITGPAVSVGNYYHIIVKASGTTAELKVNDVSYGGITGSVDMSHTTGSFYLGSSRTGISSYYNGKIDQYRHFNFATSDTEDTALYNGGSGA